MGEVAKLACWKSNFEAETAVLFEQQADIAVVNGQFSLDVAGELILFTVTLCANPANDLTCPPSYIII